MNAPMEMWLRSMNAKAINAHVIKAAASEDRIPMLEIAAKAVLNEMTSAEGPVAEEVRLIREYVARVLKLSNASQSDASHHNQLCVRLLRRFNEQIATLCNKRSAIAGVKFRSVWSLNHYFLQTLKFPFSEFIEEPNWIRLIRPSDVIAILLRGNGFTISHFLPEDRRDPKAFFELSRKLQA